MRVILSVPSKTFLLGEYAVLDGGSALLLNTEPRFKLVVDVKGQSQIEGVHPSSPAGVWVRAHREDFLGVSASFVDPHEGFGGFGASSAQFALCHLWSLLQGSSLSRVSQGFNTAELLRAFVEQNQQEAKIVSGADVVSQVVGSVTHFQAEPFHGEGWDWPFADLSVVVARTGHKVSTHVHLQKIGERKYSELREIAEKATGQFHSSESQGFVVSVNEYAKALERQGLVLDSSQSILSRIRENHKILAAKGCGAMGADVILALCLKEHRLDVRQCLTDQGLKVVADEGGLSTGARFEVDLEPRFDFRRESRRAQGLIDA